MFNKQIENLPYDVIDYHGNKVTTVKAKKLVKIMAEHYSYHELQMTVRQSKES